MKSLVGGRIRIWRWKKSFLLELVNLVSAFIVRTLSWSRYTDDASDEPL